MQTLYSGNGRNAGRTTTDVIAPPFVTVPSTGSIGEANVQVWPCGVTDDCLLLIPKPDTPKEYLWIAAATLRLERWRFNYGRKITPDRIVGLVLSPNGALIESTNKSVENAIDFSQKTVLSLSGKAPIALQGDIKATFNKLVSAWKAETNLLSNSEIIILSEPYQQIIGMGEPAIPLILDALERGDYSNWFWALHAITREEPVLPDDMGDVYKMGEAWLSWGKTKGYRNG